MRERKEEKEKKLHRNLTPPLTCATSRDRGQITAVNADMKVGFR